MYQTPPYEKIAGGFQQAAIILGSVGNEFGFFPANTTKLTKTKVIRFATNGFYALDNLFY